MDDGSRPRRVHFTLRLSGLPAPLPSPIPPHPRPLSRWETGFASRQRETAPAAPEGFICMKFAG